MHVRLQRFDKLCCRSLQNACCLCRSSSLSARRLGQRYVPGMHSVLSPQAPLQTAYEYKQRFFRCACRWLLLESVVGTIIDPPTNPFGLSPVDFTFSVAANNSQTTARVFAHGINSTVVLQPQQGEHCLAAVSVPSLLRSHTTVA